MPPLPPPPESPPAGSRAFGDAPATRRAIYDNAIAAVREIPPAVGDTHTLQLTDVDWADPERFTRKQRKEAVLTGGTLARRLKGTWSLTDNATGRTVEQRHQVLGAVPYLSSLGTFTHRGSEYAVIHQQRLRPGVYARVKDNGELESHVATLPGHGVGHRYFLDPAKQLFKLHIGQAEMPLLPLLRALGATDHEVGEAWGRDLLGVNAARPDGGTIKKLAQRVLPAKELEAAGDWDDRTTRQKVAEAFQRVVLDPEVTRHTLGHPHANLSKEAILTATKKLLAISRGEAEPDDRDHLAYQTVLGPEDLFAERIRKDSGGIRRKVFRQVLRAGTLAKMPSGVLTPQFHHVLLGSGLGQPLEEVNPLEILDKQSRLTRMGEGGIADADAIPDEARNVQASHLGFVDPVRTPENLSAGIEVNAARNAVKGRDGLLYARFRDARTGQEVWRSPRDLYDAAIATPDVLAMDTRRVPVIKSGRLTHVPKQDIDYVVPEFEGAFSHLGNMVPMKSGIKAQRMAMAGRMSVSGDTCVIVFRAAGGCFRGPIADYEWLAGDYTCSIDKKTKQLVRRAVRGRVKHKNVLAMYRVTLASGRFVDATGDHSFVALDDAGQLTKIHTQKLGVGTMLPRVGVLPVPAREGAWRVSDGNKHNAHPGRSFPLDFDLGWLHGVYLSEGHGDQRKRRSGDKELSGVVLANLDAAVLRRISEFFRSRGIAAAVRCGRADGKNDRVVVNWKQFALQLKADFGNGSYAKKVPEWVFTAPEVYRQGLIAGYIAGDGEGSRKRAVARFGGSSRSLTLRDGLVDVLSTLGIGAYVRQRSVATGPRGTTVWQYRFDIPAEQLSKLPRLHHPRKDRLLAAAPWSGKRSADKLPMYAELYAQVLARTRRGDNNRYLLHAGRHTRRSLAETLGDGDSAAHAWLRSDVVWDAVAAVSPLDAGRHKWVYDLDLEDNVFACNGGVFVHNTTQALPLVGGEAPLVRAGTPDGRSSYEEEYGRHAGAVKAERPGQVLSFRDGLLKVRYDDGTAGEVELYDRHPLNRKTNFHQTPTVRPGERFGPGQLLARSNFTDAEGATALGVNARTAYLPYHGLNFEDASVISEGMARRLTSVHAYQHGLEVTPKHKTGLKPYLGLFPAKFDKQTLATLGDDGVIRPGTRVEYGQPLILAARERDRSANKIHRKRQPGYEDASVLWEHHDPGVVTDVARGKDGPIVVVESAQQMQEGDKLSGRMGDKGVVSKIVPDHLMPHDAEGRPFEILLGPDGVITRANPSQVVEGALGKIAAKTGRPYRVPDFAADTNLTEWAERELAAHGLKSTEDVTWPDTGVVTPGVGTGVRFFMKLHHQAEGKGQGRDSGGYSAEGAPAKGGYSGSKRLAMMDSNALLSHGATATLRDASLVRGQKNDDYWLQFLQGHTPRDPQVPPVYAKFLALLQAGGINAVPKGHRLHVMALTDKDVDRLAGGRELKNGETVNFDKELKPVPGGLFDPQLTGGHGGQRWSAVKLPEPLPSPAFEEPIRRLLGLTKKQYEETIAGRHEIPRHGTGPQALAAALRAVDVPKELALARAGWGAVKASHRDELVRRWGYLKSAQKLGIHPGDWVMNRVPVLPPAFRPVSLLGDKGIPLVSDPNYLYKELLESADVYKETAKAVGPGRAGDERLALYKAFKAVTGLGDPTHPKLQEKGVTGVLQQIFGKGSPKFSFMQRKLLSTAVDTVGRAVVVPQPDYDMDTLGIPENQAFDVYRKFIARRLHRRGLPLREALRHALDRTDLARSALAEELKERPVIMTRAPVLHKFGIMAFQPELVKGDVLRVNPLVHKGFNLDHDGDVSNFHVPNSAAAVREAYERLLPSKNLLSPADFRTPMAVPGQQYLAGLHHLTSPAEGPRRPVAIFRSKKDALAALARREITKDTPVEILEG